MQVKFALVSFAACLLSLQLLIHGSFHQEEVRQPHHRDTQRPNIMNYVVPKNTEIQIEETMYLQKFQLDHISPDLLNVQHLTPTGF